MSVTLNPDSTSTTAQLEEMRHVLGSLHRELSGENLRLHNLDELIRDLLGLGVTRREIGFLISEALPIQNEHRVFADLTTVA